MEEMSVRLGIYVLLIQRLCLCGADQLAQLFDAVWRVFPMNYSVAIWADWPKVFDWIDIMFRANFTDEGQMVNVNEIRGN